MLSEVSQEIMRCYVESLRSQENMNSRELYKDMVNQQPVFKLLLQSVINSDEISHDFKDGYAKGLLQAWHLLNQQAIIDDLESEL